MAPRKLSDSDKGTIIELYRQPEQTTSTLAEQYGVSNSTISRILKTTLPSDEYSELISQKRMAGSDKTDASASKTAKKSRTTKKAADKKAKPKATKAKAAQSKDTQSDETESEAESTKPKLKTTAEKDDAKTSGTPQRRRRSRSRRNSDDDEQLPLLNGDSAEPATGDDDAENDDDAPKKPTKPTRKPQPVESSADDEDDDDEDDLQGLDETLGDDFGDDDDELEDDGDDSEDDSVDLPKPKLQTAAAMSIMPLAEAVLPKPCYLVVDMRSELITCPLSEFADLGQIPNEEEKSKTLPVFDNHRVARRFSRNKQRVIKVPDGSLITRTSPYLQAKGITRLLVDGQVFDLAGR